MVVWTREVTGSSCQTTNQTRPNSTRFALAQMIPMEGTQTETEEVAVPQLSRTISGL
jgi:hypothetical protein